MYNTGYLQCVRLLLSVDGKFLVSGYGWEHGGKKVLWQVDLVMELIVVLLLSDE